MKHFSSVTVAKMKMRRAIERTADSAGTGRVTVLAGLLVLALFWINHFDLSSRQQATRQDLATVSGQAEAIASTQAAGMALSAGERLADSVERVAMISAIADLRVALEKSKDSTRLAERLNESLNAAFLAQRKAADGLYLSQLQRVQDAGNRQSKGILDSIRSEVSGLKEAVSDSVLTARLAGAAFREIYKTASLKNEWFSSELMFGKSDSGREQASVIPLFRNQTDVKVHGYVPPKRGRAGTVSVSVTEANPYAATGVKNVELSIPARKGKPKKDNSIRRNKQDTRKRQRRNFNKNGG